MRYRRLLWTKPVFLAAALIWLLPVFAAAQAVTTRMTASEVFDPMNYFGFGPVGAFTSPGTLTCPGAEPTGNPMQPCPPDRPIHLRGVTGYSRMTSQSPLLSGWFYWEMNANFDSTAAGRVWGTFRIELDAGGVWEGSWTNARGKVEDEQAWVGRARFVGRGTSGSVEGMQLRFTEVGATWTPLPFFWVVPVEAEILAPPSR